jgi:hypothetical protein
VTEEFGEQLLDVDLTLVVVFEVDHPLAHLAEIYCHRAAFRCSLT